MAQYDTAYGILAMVHWLPLISAQHFFSFSERLLNSPKYANRAVQ